MGIDAATVVKFIQSLPGVDTLHVPETHFFYYDPRRDRPRDRAQPFATLVASDEHDPHSNLARPGVYRLNVGVARETYRALFGPEPAWNLDGGPVATGHDFSSLDAFLPHPVYAPLSWICILSPTENSWPQAQAYVREAHGLARKRHEARL